MTHEEIEEKKEVKKAMNTITDFIRKNMFVLDSNAGKWWIELTRSFEGYWQYREQND